jgi:hypothetical protein
MFVAGLVGGVPAAGFLAFAAAEEGMPGGLQFKNGVFTIPFEQYAFRSAVATAGAGNAFVGASDLANAGQAVLEAGGESITYVRCMCEKVPRKTFYTTIPPLEATHEANDAWCRGKCGEDGVLEVIWSDEPWE